MGDRFPRQPPHLLSEAYLPRAETMLMLTIGTPSRRTAACGCPEGNLRPRLRPRRRQESPAIIRISPILAAGRAASWHGPPQLSGCRADRYKWDYEISTRISGVGVCQAT